MGIRAKTGVNMIWIYLPLKNRIYPILGYIISCPYQVAYMVISDIYRIFHVIYLNIIYRTHHVIYHWYNTRYLLCHLIPSYYTSIKQYCSYHHTGVHTGTSMSYSGITGSVRQHVILFDESCINWKLCGPSIIHSRSHFSLMTSHHSTNITTRGV